MNIPLSRITDIVSLMLGEYPDWRSGDHGSGESCPLSEMVEVVLEEEARTLTREAPLNEFSSPRDFRSELYAKARLLPEGGAEFRLPPDFCRLHSLRCAGWKRALNGNFSGSLLRARTGFAGHEPPSHRRPSADVVILSPDEKILRFSPASAGFPEIAAYIPEPFYDRQAGELVGIDPALLMPLCRRIYAILTRN